MRLDAPATRPTLDHINLLGGLWRFHPRYQGCVGHWIPSLVHGNYTVYDLSGFGATGTIIHTDTAPAQQWTFGCEGPVYKHFSAVETRVDIPDAARWGTNPMSWNVWLSHAESSNSSFNGPLSRTNGGAWTAGWGMYLGAAPVSGTGQIHHFVGSWNSNRTPLSSAFDLAGRTMHTAVWDSAAGSLRGYINGADVQEVTSTPGTWSAVLTGYPLLIGEVGNTSWGWTGTSEDVRIYDRVLTLDVLTSLYLEPYLEFQWAWEVLTSSDPVAMFEEGAPGAPTPRFLSLLGAGR